MKYIKIMIGITLVLLMLVSCSNNIIKNEKVGEQKAPTLITGGKEIYKTKIPVEFNVARGTITQNIENPIDVNEIEMGLMMLSMNHFSPDQFYIQEGQYLTGKMINNWIARKSKEQEEGLNPPINDKEISDNIEELLNEEKENPKILSHILEQNYIDNAGKIKGISLAISLNQFYYISVKDKDGLIYTDQIKINQNNNGVNEVRENGKKIAEEVLKRIRVNKDIPDVPIYLTLYEEQSRSSIIPGEFLAEAFISQGENTIDKWENINREYLQLSSAKVEEIDRTTSNSFKNFKDDVEKYFSNIDIKVLGQGLYIDKTLTDLKININSAALSKPQAVGLIQFVGGEIQSGMLPNGIPITITVSSMDRQMGIIIWDPIEKNIQTYVDSN